MKGKEPVRVSLVQLMALFGDSFSDKGYAEENGHEIGIVYHPSATPPTRRHDRKPMTLDDFDEKVHEHIKRALMADNEGVHGMVVFECGNMDSSCLGERKGMVYGPNCTYKTLDESWWYDKEKGQVNRLDTELASTQKAPICYYEKEDVDDSHSQPDATDAAATT